MLAGRIAACQSVADRTLPIHRRLAQIALQIGGRYGFALAGGHAIAAHGILDRPSEDVDLFAAWQRRADFPPPWTR